MLESVFSIHNSVFPISLQLFSISLAPVWSNSLAALEESILLGVQEMLQNVFRNAKDTFEIYRDTDGAHVENSK